MAEEALRLAAELNTIDGAADLFEAGEEIIHPEAAFLRAAEIVEDLPPMHHDEAVTEVDCLVHGVGHHENGQPVEFGQTLFLVEPTA